MFDWGKRGYELLKKEAFGLVKRGYGLSNKRSVSLARQKQTVTKHVFVVVVRVSRCGTSARVRQSSGRHRPHSAAHAALQYYLAPVPIRRGEGAVRAECEPSLYPAVPGKLSLLVEATETTIYFLDLF